MSTEAKRSRLAVQVPGGEFRIEDGIKRTAAHLVRPDERCPLEVVDA